MANSRQGGAWFFFGVAFAVILIGLALYFRYVSRLAAEAHILDVAHQSAGRYIRRLGTFGTEPCGYVARGPLAEIDQIVEPYSGFDAVLVAVLPQSYAGYAIAVGDIDGDGQNELLEGTAPDSRIYVHKYDPQKNAFTTDLFAEELAGPGCSESRLFVAGAVGRLVIEDLNGDGQNEVVAMTDQVLSDSRARLWVFWREEGTWRRHVTPVETTGFWTRGLAAHDAAGDGARAIFAVQRRGAVLRFAFSGNFSTVTQKVVEQLGGFGRSLEIADIFNSGQKRLILSEVLPDGRARVTICGLTAQDISERPEVIIEGYGGQSFEDAIVCTGDVDNDGKVELIVAWISRGQERHLVSLVAYRFDACGSMAPPQVLLERSTLFGSGDLNGRMAIGSVRRDGKNRLYIASARGDEFEYREYEYWNKDIHSERWGLYEISVAGSGRARVAKICNFNHKYVTGAKVAIGRIGTGDQNVLIVGTGFQKLTRHGSKSYLFLLQAVAD